MIIGTRGSELARTQAAYVAEVLTDRLGLEPAISVIRTQGDRVIDRPLRELEGRGYFTKEIEEALLAGSIDVAVHSFKDMPSKAPDGLAIAAVSTREDPADLLIMRPETYDPAGGDIPLPEGMIIGTSAVRRESQLMAMRPDLNFRDLRGNVPTRLNKLIEHGYDAVFLAAAGVHRLRLDLSELKVVRLNPASFVPAPGQGALAIQMRVDDPAFETVREALHDPNTATATAIERRVQARFGGGCGLPLGVFACQVQGRWEVHGFWGGDTHRPRWAEITDHDPERIAEKLYQALTP